MNTSKYTKNLPQDILITVLMIIPWAYLSCPIGQMVMEGKGMDSIGTCHTDVITGFAAQSLKH